MCRALLSHQDTLVKKTDKEDPGFSGAYIFVEGAEGELYI